MAAPPSTQASSKAASERARFFGAGDEAAFLRVHERRGDAGLVEGLEHFVLGGGPLVGIASAGGDEAGNGAAGHAAGGGNEHLQVEAVSEAPEELADGVAGDGAHGAGSGDGSDSGGHGVHLG